MPCKSDVTLTGALEPSTRTLAGSPGGVCTQGGDNASAQVDPKTFAETRRGVRCSAGVAVSELPRHRTAPLDRTVATAPQTLKSASGNLPLKHRQRRRATPTSVATLPSGQRLGCDRSAPRPR